jgi:cystathionine beta-lyase family protein involved in aluminum resistance
MIKPDVHSLIGEAEKSVISQFEAIDTVAEINQLKVLKAMQEHKLSDIHFNWHTGYGYDDVGRETVEKIYSSIFHTEDAIVRPIIVSGTHALSLALQGVLRPGDRMLAITGKPYDTLEKVIGLSPSEGLSLMDIGVTYEEVSLKADGAFDTENILKALTPETKMVYIQRSAGYAWRKSVTIKDIETVISNVRTIAPSTIVMVDNCYGEFLEPLEPTDVGADLMAGSLIKNPGGGLALSGGYIVGKSTLVDQVAARMTTPGIGKECGLTFGQTRPILQGLFMAPTVVAGAIKGAILCASVFSRLGYSVNPNPTDSRSDIIQAIELGNAESVIAFCKGIQAASPVDSFVSPEPWAMPGYQDDVIMAAGAFVQGSSIELSADAPIRPPYIVYFQGGLTYAHAKFGVTKAVNTLYEQQLIQMPSKA